MNKKSIITLAIFIAVPMALGIISSLLAGDIKGIYNSLNTPPLSPPDFLFGIVWPILYILMGISAFLVFTADASRMDKTRALIVFGIQLFLNIIWSPIFFGVLNLWLAVVVVLALDIVMLFTIYLFFQIRKVSGILLVPYVLWIFFATYLTIGCAILN